MMRRHGKKETSPDVMSRQETAVWLGRSLSTNEITLHVVLDLLDVIAFQQAVITQLSERGDIRHASDDGQTAQATLNDEPDVSQKIVEKLARWREDLHPVLKAVEDACQQCEKVLKPT